jgi:hypothetical protein
MYLQQQQTSYSAAQPRPVLAGALTLAAVAASKAFLEASSSASSDEMRALAVARASAVHQGEKENSSKEAKKGIQDKQI